MVNQHVDQVTELFDQVLALAPDKRPGFLDELGEGSPLLRSEVAALLDAREDAPAILASLRTGLISRAFKGRSVARVAFEAPRLSTGSKIAHYRINRYIGGGGMGLVYAAEDERLRRQVAIKFLPSAYSRDADLRARFEREAQAASALDHPNICTIHEIGETESGLLYIVMAFCDGETLSEKIAREPLPVAEATSYARQIAEGLKAVHRQKIVHRDVKPANVIVLPDGLVKLLDFGVAKMISAPITKHSSLVGTVAYMSPEQARGEEVDQRSDIWSLGVVLYEMLTGEYPFRGEYELAIIYSILNESPRSIKVYRSDVPEDISAILTRCLEKDVRRRYASMDAFLADLIAATQGVTRRTVASPDMMPDIAVLPFADLSREQDQEYFCDGLAEEIIYALTRVKGLRVIARTTSFAFKGEKMDVREIGRKLGVDTVLEGGVRRSGNRLRITVELTDVGAGYHIWSARYDQDLDDIFAIQEEIARGVTEKLRGGLQRMSPMNLVRPQTANMDAYIHYLKGRFHLNKEHPTFLHTATQYFREAIERDPSFVPAYVGLAKILVHQIFHDFHDSPPAEVYAQASAILDDALSCDERYAEIYAVTGLLKNLRWDWEGAERAYQRAFELEPSDVTALSYCPWHLGTTGRMREAIEMLQEGERLDPLRLEIKGLLCLFYSYVSDHESAFQQCQEMLEIDSNFHIGYQLRGSLFMDLGRFEEALSDFQHAISLLGRQPRLLKDIGSMYAAWGRYDEAIKIARELEELRAERYVNPTNVAAIYHKLGDTGAMCQWLEKAYEERDPWLITLTINPFHKGIEQEACFRSVLKRMGADRIRSIS